MSHLFAQLKAVKKSTQLDLTFTFYTEYNAVDYNVN